MDDESAKDPAVFYIRIFGRLVIEKLFLALRSFFFRFARPDFYFRIYRLGTFRTFIVHGGTQTKHCLCGPLGGFAIETLKMKVPFSLVSHRLDPIL